jgi:AbrB family looped-hinge helix DNA binding protein
MQGGIEMPIVKVGRSRQVTIPKKLFEELDLKEGDYVEVERKGNRLILTPKELIDRDKAKAKLFALISRIRERNKDASPEEVEEALREALEEVRARRKEQKKSKGEDKSK